MQSNDRGSSNCQCDKPPFDFTRFKTLALGEDSFGAEISIETCKNCGLAWVKYFIEEPHHSRSGRWWRVALPTENHNALTATNAREFVEQQAVCFVGGSFFESTGHRIYAPIKIT